MVKLKLNTKADGQPPTPSSETPATPSSGVKIKFKTAQPSPILPPPPPAGEPEASKQKRKYTKKKDKDEHGDTPEKGKSGKKRKAKDVDDDGDTPNPPKKKNTGEAKPTSMKIRIPSTSTSGAASGSKAGALATLPKITIPTPIVKLRLSSAKRSASTPNIRLKAKGKPPHRPLGVGYDSEGEGIEIDPSIEQQFILRMPAGEDCDYLREAIETKRVGVPVAAGGADVHMRFFDKEGRRGVVSIRGRHYAATMLDLPCIVESMKSWDRKGWYKAADICQVLLVRQRVKDEDEAKKLPLKRDIDTMNWQYPHGLTPPMHYVRKRRFRKRLNFRTIEAVEEEVARLLRADEDVGPTGSSDAQLLDYEQYLRESEQAEDDADELANGAYGDVIPGYEGGDDDGALAEGDLDEMAALMEQELARGGGDDDVPDSAISTAPGVTINSATGSKLHASPDALHPPTGLPSDSGPSPSGTTGTGTDDDAAEGLFSGDDEDDEDDEDAVDEEELARQRELAQQREEIDDLRKEIAAAEAQMARQANSLLKQRAAAKVKSLKADLQLKMGGMGDGDDDE